MVRPIKVLFLPGLGDSRAWGQDKLIKIWRLARMIVHYHQIGWATDESYESKFKKALASFDELAENSDKIAIVGVSAGASMAMNVYMARKERVSGLVFICGKIYGFAPVNPSYFVRNPAFKQALLQSEAATGSLTDEDKLKMLTISSWRDFVIPLKFSTIQGVKSKRVPTIGHIPSIFFSIVAYPWIIARFIRSTR